MGDIQMQITIPNDNDGFTLLKCELCGGYFKLRPSEIQDDSVIYVWCPNCGLLSESYITDDVIDLAMKISKNLVIDNFNKEMKRMEKKFKGNGLSFKQGNKIKKDEELREDERDMCLDIVQEMIEKFNKIVDEKFKEKENELTSI